MSKAREDFPEPLTPVTTVMASLGNDRVKFLRLCSRHPCRRIQEVNDVEALLFIPKLLQNPNFEVVWVYLSKGVLSSIIMRDMSNFN